MQCNDCKNFRPPNKEYEENSLGLCEVMESWLDKFFCRQPWPKKYNENYAKLGGKLWMPYIERDCERFEQKETK